MHLPSCSVEQHLVYSQAGLQPRNSQWEWRDSNSLRRNATGLQPAPALLLRRTPFVPPSLSSLAIISNALVTPTPVFHVLGIGAMSPSPSCHFAQVTSTFFHVTVKAKELTLGHLDEQLLPREIQGSPAYWKALGVGINMIELKVRLLTTCHTGIPEDFS